MRNTTLCLMIVLASASCGSAGAAGVKPGPVVSWGKPDVSFDDYRKDAIECG
jgi:hypothetical protein